MITPIRCPICGRELSSVAHIVYEFRASKEGKNNIAGMKQCFESIGLSKYCCRMQFNSNDIKPNISQ